MVQNLSPQTESEDRPWVLVTGSSGLIGKALAKRLVRHYRVLGIDLHDTDFTSDGFHHEPADLTDDESTAHALDMAERKTGGHLSAVVHLAAYYDFSGEDSPMYQRLTVNGTRRLLEGLRNRFRVGRFVFSSSLLVMRPTEPGGHPITEKSPLDAAWPYPQSKLDAEQLIRKEHGDMPVVVLRIAGVYDAWCRCLPITHQIQRIYEKQLEGRFFPGDPECGNPFIHLEDVTSCIECVIEQSKSLKSEDTFLVAEPDVVSYELLQDRIGELLHGRQWPTIRIPKAVAKAGAWANQQVTPEENFVQPWMVDVADQHYAVSIAHARDCLGWQPEHRLLDELPNMIDKLKQNPEAWYARNGLAD